MKSKIRYQLMVLALLALSTLNSQLSTVFAQETRWFRISGPTATIITAFRPDGTLFWSNAQPGGIYTVQTTLSLTGGYIWVDYVQIPVTNAINANRLIDPNPPAGMALIPAGMFTMGNSIGDSDITNATSTNVKVSAFYMDVNLVSYSLWQSVCNWATNNGYDFDYVTYVATLGSGIVFLPNYPVMSVNWYDTVKWCNARSQQAGLFPVYFTDAGLTQVYTSGDTDAVYPNWAANGYRLPTEAEWEKAARGGLSGKRFPWGDTISESQANYYGDTTNYSYDLGPDGLNSAGAYNSDTYGRDNATPVGYFAPNGYRLYDMAGNAFEWCWDRYGTPYGQPTATNPTGPASGGSGRVLRGGNYGYSASLARCAFRFYFDAFVTVYFQQEFCFRCVRGH